MQSARRIFLSKAFYSCEEVEAYIECVFVGQFVEKRREMKADGRTEKELEESFCFLLADSFRVRI